MSGFEFAWSEATVGFFGFQINEGEQIDLNFQTNLDSGRHDTNFFSSTTAKCEDDEPFDIKVPGSLKDDGSVDVTIELTENLIENQAICILMGLKFEDELIASTKFSFTPRGVIDQSSAQTNVVISASDLTVNKNDNPTDYGLTPDAGTRNANVFSASVSPSEARYGEMVGWSINGDNKFWYKITDVSSQGKTLTETDWSGCSSGKAGVNCIGIIPLSFFAGTLPLTATISYEWYSYDPNQRFLLSDEEHVSSGERGVDLGRLLQSGADDDNAGSLSGTGSIETTITLAPLAADYEKDALLIAGNGFEMNVKNGAMISAAAVALFGLVIAAFGVLIVTRRFRKMEQNHRDNNSNEKSLEETIRDNNSNEKSLEETIIFFYGNDNKDDSKLAEF